MPPGGGRDQAQLCVFGPVTLPSVHHPLVVSPHLDDAVFSAGQFLAANPGTTVLTVFAGSPRAIKRTEWDAKCGFAQSADAIVFRKAEDRRALAAVGARAVHLDYLDHQYRDDSHRRNDPGVDVSIANSLSAQVDESRPNLILGPLGADHPDHEQVRRALLLADLDIPIWLYADLPYCALDPKQIKRAKRSVEREGFTLDAVSQDWGAANRSVKLCSATPRKFEISVSKACSPGNGFSH